MSTTFWDRLWRSAGIQFVGLFIIAYFIYGRVASSGGNDAGDLKHRRPRSAD